MTRAFPPAPWFFHDTHEANVFLLCDTYRWLISFRQNGEMLTDEQKAIAQLCATAPKLFYALETATDCLAALEATRVEDYELKQIIADCRAVLREALKVQP
jgi:hypothetical protein